MKDKNNYTFQISLKGLVKLAFLISFLLVSCSHGIDLSSAADNFPRLFSGTFNWHGDQSIQRLSLEILDISIEPDKRIVASGKGVYHVGDETFIDIKIEIDPETMRFEMWELNADGSLGFVTDGSHVGKISDDLKDVKAVWTSKKGGKQGTLILQAQEVY